MANQNTAASSREATLLPGLELGAGLLLQTGFLVAAVVLFRERTLYADTAQFAAEMAGGHHLFLGHRLVAVLTRILPYAAAVSGASIKGILVAYSLNLALLFTLPWLLLRLVFKDRALSLTLLLLQFLFTFFTFYLPISELQHGLVLLLVYWGWLGSLDRRGRPARLSPGVYLLLAVIMNAHPLMVLAFTGSAALFYKLAGYWKPPDQRVLLPFGILVFLGTLVFASTSYEGILIRNAWKALGGSADIYHLRLMAHYLRTDYLPALLAGAVGFCLIVWRVPRISTAFLMICLSALALLVYLRFAHITLTRTYFEIYLLPAPFLLFLGLSLYRAALPRRARVVVNALLVLLIALQSYHTLRHAAFFRDRLELYASVLEDMQARDLNKAVLPFYRAPMEKIVDAYASPFESYLLSRIDDDPANDGLHFTYLLADSITTGRYRAYDRHFIAQGMDTLAIFPYERYPHFELVAGPYATFDPDYP